MADSLILSTAWSEQATLWTQDEHFAGLPGVEYRTARTKVPGVRGKSALTGSDSMKNKTSKMV
jgi:hypothetical protein